MTRLMAFGFLGATVILVTMFASTVGGESLFVH